RWRVLYQGMEAGLAAVPGLRLIPRPQHEDYVGSSFQFLLPGWEAARVAAMVAGCAARGVELKWFGAAEPQGFTSRYAHWQYARPVPLPRTDRILAGLIDMRLPLTFTPEDVALIARIIAEEVARAAEAERLAPVAVAAAD
ncbi:MAG: aminotransferase, partial [Bryobacteraceae bacterium]